MAFETTENDASIDNNTGVPVGIHLLGTFLVVAVFAVALEQACSISIDHQLFRVRVGVLLSNSLLCVLAVVINVDLLREEGYIDFLDEDFVLIVRTLQVFWLFITFLIGYGFVTDSIQKAYQLSSKISSQPKRDRLTPSSRAHHQLHHIMSRKAPSWMSKFWAFCTVIQEIALFLFFIVAFTTQDILYFHICWISSMITGGIGGILVIVALIDITRYVYHTTRSTNEDHSIDNANLHKLKRLLMVMIILGVLIIILCSVNVALMLGHLVRLNQHHNLHREGSLKSRALDNVNDYIIYFCILIFIEMIFVFWTYKPAAVNYCIFCCFGYKQYSHPSERRREFVLDTNTMFYAFCKECIDSAEVKRLKLMEENKKLQKREKGTEEAKEPVNNKQPSYFFSVENQEQELRRTITAASPPRNDDNVLERPKQTTVPMTSNDEDTEWDRD